jgi:hypothetical protein
MLSSLFLSMRKRLSLYQSQTSIGKSIQYATPASNTPLQNQYHDPHPHSEISIIIITLNTATSAIGILRIVESKLQFSTVASAWQWGTGVRSWSS